MLPHYPDFPQKKSRYSITLPAELKTLPSCPGIQPVIPIVSWQLIFHSLPLQTFLSRIFPLSPFDYLCYLEYYTFPSVPNLHYTFTVSVTDSADTLPPAPRRQFLNALQL